MPPSLPKVFKAYGTYKVERRIKLESHGAGTTDGRQRVRQGGKAMKQPFLLRRLDVLAITLSAVWCFSPIGSQAFQRVYVNKRDVQFYQVDLYYVARLYRVSGCQRRTRPEQDVRARPGHRNTVHRQPIIGPSQRKHDRGSMCASDSEFCRRRAHKHFRIRCAYCAATAHHSELRRNQARLGTKRSSWGHPLRG